MVPAGHKRPPHPAHPLGSFRNRSVPSETPLSLPHPLPRFIPEHLCLSGTARGFPDSLGSLRISIVHRRSSGGRGLHSFLSVFFPYSFRNPSALSADRAGPLCGADVISGRAIKGRVRAARAVRGGGRGAGGRSLRTHRPGEGMGRRAGGRGPPRGLYRASLGLTQPRTHSPAQVCG